MMITLLIAFAVGIVLGKVMLPVLHKLKFGQNIYCLLYTSPSPRDTR